MKIAVKAIPRPAEGEKGHRRSDPDIDPYVADFRFVAELARARAVRREEARLVAVLPRVDQCDRLVDIRGVVNREHRAKSPCG